jgi:hypothetical protein
VFAPEVDECDTVTRKLVVDTNERFHICVSDEPAVPAEYDKRLKMMQRNEFKKKLIKPEMIDGILKLVHDGAPQLPDEAL